MHSEPHTPAGEVGLGAADRGCVTAEVPHDSDPPQVMGTNLRGPEGASRSNPGRVYRSLSLSKTQLKCRGFGAWGWGWLEPRVAAKWKMESLLRNLATGGSLPRGSSCSDFHVLNTSRRPRSLGGVPRGRILGKNTLTSRFESRSGLWLPQNWEPPGT